MANRFPLIVNTSASQIQEIASGDNLDLTGSNIVNSSATLTLPTVTGTLATLAGTESLSNKTITASSFAGSIAATTITASSTLAVTGDQTNSGDLAVNGGDITTTATTATLFNTNATTLSIGGAATTLNLGAATGTTTIANNLSNTLGALFAGAYGGSYTDGTVVDYTTGTGRITVGASDGVTIYTGGTSSRSALLALDSSGNATVTGNVTVSGTSHLKLPSGTTAQRPGSPAAGQIRYNSDLTRFEGYSSGAWGSLGGGATGGGQDQIFMLNGQTVTTNYSIPSGNNALSAGPITINTGVTVTIPTGSTWVIV